MKLFEVSMYIIVCYFKCDEMFCYKTSGIAPQIRLFVFLVTFVYIKYSNLSYISEVLYTREELIILLLCSTQLHHFPISGFA